MVFLAVSPAAVCVCISFRTRIGGGRDSEEDVCVKKKRGGIWVAGQSQLRRGKPGGDHAASHMEFVRVRKIR